MRGSTGSTGRIDVHERVQTRQAGSPAAKLRSLTLPVGKVPIEHDLIGWLAGQLRCSCSGSNPILLLLLLLLLLFLGLLLLLLNPNLLQA